MIYSFGEYEVVRDTESKRKKFNDALKATNATIVSLHKDCVNKLFAGRVQLMPVNKEIFERISGILLEEPEIIKGQ